MKRYKPLFEGVTQFIQIKDEHYERFPYLVHLRNRLNRYGIKKGHDCYFKLLKLKNGKFCVISKIINESIVNSSILIENSGANKIGYLWWDAYKSENGVLSIPDTFSNAISVDKGYRRLGVAEKMVRYVMNLTNSSRIDAPTLSANSIALFKSMKLIKEAQLNNIKKIDVFHTGKFYIHINKEYLKKKGVTPFPNTQFTSKNLIERLNNESDQVFTFALDMPDSMDDLFEKCLKNFNNFIKKSGFTVIDENIDENRYYTYKVKK